MTGYEVDAHSLFTHGNEQIISQSAHDHQDVNPETRRRPGRPRKNDLDEDLEIILAEVENNDTKVIERMKRNQSSRKYRKNKNNKLCQKAKEVEKLQAKNKWLQKIYAHNEMQIAKIFRELKRSMNKKIRNRNI